MLTRRDAILISASSIVSLIPIPALSAEQKLESRTSSENGVGIVVTPKHVGQNDAVWEFDVSMNTHVRALNEDIVKDSALLDDSGRRYTATQWQGTGPGGHHRTGTLQFTRPDGPSKTITLEIDGVGGSQKRIFSWRLQ